jgi:hypothetical protein
MEPMAESDWHDWVQMRNGLLGKFGSSTPHLTQVDWELDHLGIGEIILMIYYGEYVFILFYSFFFFFFFFGVRLFYRAI